MRKKPVTSEKSSTSKPLNLTNTESLLWDALQKVIGSRLKPEDMLSFHHFVQTVDRANRLRAMFEELDDYTSLGASRLHRMLKAEQGSINTYTIKFGMTPADRAGLQLESETKSDIVKFLEEQG